MAGHSKELFSRNIGDPQKYFHGKRVLVMGLGFHGGGIGTVRFLARQGARVTVTDLRTKTDLKESLDRLRQIDVRYVLGGHQESDFRTADLIVKNPGVPWNSSFLRIARKHRVPVDTDIGIFFELCPAPIIGITGTKGKSTVATLLAKILYRHSRNVVLAGNIGFSVLSSLPKITKTTRVVLELSSWQLEGTARHKKSPSIALVTNILPDHLNAYKTLACYVEAKKGISRYQRETDILFLNFDDRVVRSFGRGSRARVVYFSQKHDLSKISKKAAGAFVRENWILDGYSQTKILPLGALGLGGEHNLNNVLGAVSVARELKIPLRTVRAAIREFRGVAGRTEVITEINGRKFVNDTTATMPDATLAALCMFGSRKHPRLILIGGGEDKGLAYTTFARQLPRYVKRFILFPGSASQKIVRELSRFHPAFLLRNTREARSMREAVAAAWKGSQRGDTILLSPGAASFNMFKNEFDRGEQFIEAVNDLKKN